MPMHKHSYVCGFGENVFNLASVQQLLVNHTVFFAAALCACVPEQGKPIKRVGAIGGDVSVCESHTYIWLVGFNGRWGSTSINFKWAESSVIWFISVINTLKWVNCAELTNKAQKGGHVTWLFRQEI